MAPADIDMRVKFRLENGIYNANKYLRERGKRLQERLSRQRKVSLEEFMKQYQKVKQGSSRARKSTASGELVVSK
jgi:hypothetical protein